MGLRTALYKAATLAWMFLLFGGLIAVDLGLAEPWLSISAIPGGLVGGFAGAIVATVVVGKVIAGRIDRIQRAEWETIGRQAGLRPAEGDADRTALSGTVDGRAVRARYEKQSVGGGRGSSTTVWLTYGVAELSGAAEEGVIVGDAGGRVDAGIGAIDFDGMAEAVPAVEAIHAVETDGLFLVGTSPAAVEAVAGGLSGDALRAIRDLNVVAIGDAAGVVAEWAEAHNAEIEGVGSSLAEHPVDRLVERVPGDAGTVTIETRGRKPIRDGDDLRRFLEGAVAIADAFEAATASGPGSG